MKTKHAINSQDKQIDMVNDSLSGNDRLLESAQDMYECLEMLEEATELSGKSGDSKEMWVKWLRKVEEIEKTFPKILRKIRGLE